jgi:hypothetical protein
MEKSILENLGVLSKEPSDEYVTELKSKAQELEQCREKFLNSMSEKERVCFDMASAAHEATFCLFDDLKADGYEPGKPKRIRICGKFQFGEFQRTCACWGIDAEEEEEDVNPIG